MDEITRAREELPLPAHLFEILLVLGEAPAHGYAIIRALEAQSEGSLRLSTSSLYAALKQLHDRGLVEDAGSAPEKSEGPARRYYRVTPLGRRVVLLEAERLRRSLSLAEERFGEADATSDGRVVP